MSTVGTAHIHDATLSYPLFGSWRLNAVLEGGDLPTVGSTTTVTLGDLSLVGVVLRSGDDAPDRPHVVVSGGAGWNKLITAPLSFQSDGGVRLSTVLQALASAAGETIEQPAETILGGHYECTASRTEEPVRFRDALAELARTGAVARWRVDPDGVTRFGARVGTEIAARSTVLTRDAGSGVTYVGLDSPSAFLPGNTLDGALVSRLVVHEASGRLSGELWTTEPAGTPSLRDLVRRMVADELARYVRTYVVANVHGDKRLDLVPPPDAPHLPELANVEQWTLGGTLLTPHTGAQVLVVYRDGNPTRPVALAWDSSNVPTTTALGGGGPGVARVGDCVGRFMFDSGAMTLYYSPSSNDPLTEAPYVAVASNPNTPNPPTQIMTGTPVTVVTGSGKVTAG